MKVLASAVAVVIVALGALGVAAPPLLLDMVRPSWLIFSSRGRRARVNELARTLIYRAIAFVGAILSLPIAISYYKLAEFAHLRQRMLAARYRRRGIYAPTSLSIDNMHIAWYSVDD